MHMRLLISTALALTAALVAAGPAIDLAAAQKNRPKDIKVIVSFEADEDETGNQIQSDGGGPYQDGVDGVNAYIAASNSGALIFGTGGQNMAVRTLTFFFDDCLLLPADCNAPSTWPSPLTERGGLLANVLRGGVVPAGGLMAMTVNEELSAWIKFDIPIDSDPAYYNVCFDSRKAIGPCAAAPGVTSSDARIRREAQDEWTIWADTSDRADLIRDSQTKKNRTFTLMGTYSMPFSFSVTCVNAADCS
jgi:hypothetical protein